MVMVFGIEIILYVYSWIQEMIYDLFGYFLIYMDGRGLIWIRKDFDLLGIENHLIPFNPYRLGLKQTFP